METDVIHPGTVFPYFANLPAGVRERIWKRELSIRRVIAVRTAQDNHDITKFFPNEALQNGQKYHLQEDTLGVYNPVHPLFHTCRESRHFAMARFWLQLGTKDGDLANTRFDTRRDQLFIPFNFLGGHLYSCNILNKQLWNAQALLNLRSIYFDARFLEDSESSDALIWFLMELPALAQTYINFHYTDNLCCMHPTKAMFASKVALDFAHDEMERIDYLRESFLKRIGAHVNDAGQLPWARWPGIDVTLLKVDGMMCCTGIYDRNTMARLTAEKFTGEEEDSIAGQLRYGPVRIPEYLRPGIKNDTPAPRLLISGKKKTKWVVAVKADKAMESEEAIKSEETVMSKEALEKAIKIEDKGGCEP